MYSYEYLARASAKIEELIADKAARINGANELIICCGLSADDSVNSVVESWEAQLEEMRKHRASIATAMKIAWNRENKRCLPRVFKRKHKTELTTEQASKLQAALDWLYED